MSGGFGGIWGVIIGKRVRVRGMVEHIWGEVNKGNSMYHQQVESISSEVQCTGLRGCGGEREGF